MAAAFNLLVFDRTGITTISRKITVTMAEIVAHARWPDHDPGDEDSNGWLTAPLAPEPARPTMYDDLVAQARRLFE